jgi:hypothetical protein
MAVLIIKAYRNPEKFYVLVVEALYQAIIISNRVTGSNEDLTKGFVQLFRKC